LATEECHRSADWLRDPHGRDFIKYVYDQQTQASAPAKEDNQSSEAFGKWKPK